MHSSDIGTVTAVTISGGTRPRSVYYASDRAGQSVAAGDTLPGVVQALWGDAPAA